MPVLGISDLCFVPVFMRYVLRTYKPFLAVCLLWSLPKRAQQIGPRAASVMSIKGPSRKPPAILGILGTVGPEIGRSGTENDMGPNQTSREFSAILSMPISVLGAHESNSLPGRWERTNAST